MISLIAQKFVTDVSISAFQWHKVQQKGIQKDKRFAKEKKITFTMGDLQMALEEKGIDTSRPYYFL
ncbi:Transcription initiation factor TFIID subunit 10 [Gurleya vavrai]